MRLTIEEILYDICDNEHSSCNDNCPVYKLDDSSVPDTIGDFKKNRGCDCFKDGKEMRKFIETKLGRKLTSKDFLEQITYSSNL